LSTDDYKDAQLLVWAARIDLAMADQTRTLADYRPQHDDNCEWHLCAVCTDGNTFRACKVAGADHRQRMACSCGLDALLKTPTAPAVTQAREALDTAIADYGSVNPRVIGDLDKAWRKVDFKLDAYAAALSDAQQQEIERLKTELLCAQCNLDAQIKLYVGDKEQWILAAQQERRRAEAAEQEIERLNGQLDACEQHVKILSALKDEP
jgi:hypothetical protein